MYPWASETGEELIKFKPALLRNVSVNYAPNGVPSFFAGTNLPTFIQIRLEFVETEYFTGEDFGAERRSDAISNATETLQQLGAELFNSDVENIIPEQQDELSIQDATESSEIQGKISTNTAKSRVNANMKPGTSSEDNVIGVFQINDQPYEVGIGRASDSVNATTISTDRSLTGSVEVGQGEYYITYTDQSGARSGARGPFKTLSEAFDDLANGPFQVLE